MDGHGQRKSILERYVPNISERESFWMKIKESNADQRNYCILKNKEEYVIFIYYPRTKI